MLCNSAARERCAEIIKGIWRRFRRPCRCCHVGKEPGLRQLRRPRTTAQVTSATGGHSASRCKRPLADRHLDPPGSAYLRRSRSDRGQRCRLRDREKKARGIRGTAVPLSAESYGRMGVPVQLLNTADTAAASGVVVKGFRQERASSVWACARATVFCTVLA
jgi:hypothetical protein